MVNILRHFFSLDQYWGSYSTTIIPRILNMSIERFFLQVWQKKCFPKNSNMTPLNFVKNSFFRNFVFFKRSRGAEYQLNISPRTLSTRSSSGPFSPDYNRGSASHQTYHQYWNPAGGVSSASVPSVSFQAIQIFWIPASFLPPLWEVAIDIIASRWDNCICEKKIHEKS